MAITFQMYPPYSGPYPEGMESPHNKAIWDGMYETRMRLSSAIERCQYTAMTEKIMGYADSARQYDDMALEFKEVKTWIEKHMHTLLELA